MSQKHIDVHRITDIPYNNLLRWARGEHTPETKSLEQIEKAGLDPTPYAKPVVERYSRYVYKCSEAGETSSACHSVAQGRDTTQEETPQKINPKKTA